MDAPLYGLLLCLVLSSAGAFFVDTEKPVIFQNSNRSFGYQVVQLDKWVIVSAPLQQVSTNKTGQLYKCDPGTGLCTAIPITESKDDIDISLGLSLAAQENTSQFIACGPTLQKSCWNNMYVIGRCYLMDKDLKVLRTFPNSLKECGSRSMDIVFLIDGSDSINEDNFQKMLDFVSNVTNYFNGTDTQFALGQYAEHYTTQFDFKRFNEVRDFALLRKQIKQRGGWTKTFKAIDEVLTKLFGQGSGNRDPAEKVLIIITDGESMGDNTNRPAVIKKANKLGVRRFAIAVGADKPKPSAYEELKTISSAESEDHIFNVTDYSALKNYQKALQEKILTIEGTQSLNGSSFQMEMSQEGFSAILTSDGPILGAVGAYGWSGGAYIYRTGQQNGTWINATKDKTDMRDSYMGYAIQEVEEDLVAIGAPRYQHLGSVFIYKRNPNTSLWSQVATVRGDKIGSYFGAVLGKLPLNTSQSLLVVGAPTYYSAEVPGGQVYLCPIPQIINSHDPSEGLVILKCPQTLHGDLSQSVGHFGSAISVLPDLTGDQLADLAIGAPCEDNHQGALYIFPGQPGGFRNSYIQRIVGQQVSKGIMYFGRSVAGNLDMTQDNIPDLVVGGEGQVLVLRSRPVLKVSVSMRFDPIEIPLAFYECTDNRRQGNVTTIMVHFTNYFRNKEFSGKDLGTLTYTLLLDAGRVKTRALFINAERSITTTLPMGEMSHNHSIHLPESVDDSLLPLRVAFNFSLTGNPVLSEDSRTNYSEEISFEKNCGSDGVCQDDLSVNLTFAGLTQLVVGTSLDINITVSVNNQGDDSYNARVLIPFPSGLSYRRVSLIKSNKRVTVSCSTLERENVVNCGVNNPLLRPNTTAIFVVSFHVSPTAELGDTLTLTSNVTSDNRGASNELRTSSSRIRVLYAIYVTITSLEESSKYQNFSSPDTTVRHVYKVINLGDRRVPLSVIFLIHVRLEETPVWEKINITSSQPELSTCNVTGETPGAESENYRELLKRSPVLNFTAVDYLRAACEIRDLEVQTSVIFTISGTVTKDWTTKTEEQKMALQSSAFIVYNSWTYQHILEQNQQFVTAQAQTVLEIYKEYNFYPVIIGSSIGGLVLLALIAAGLYKLGFFTRRYRQMLEEPEVERAANSETEEGPESSGAPE